MCGTELDAILESEEALVEMGALGKNHAVGPWWDRIRQVDTLLNERKLPAWAEAQKLPEVRHLVKKSRTKRARTELPPQCKNCGGTEFRKGDLVLPFEQPMPFSRCQGCHYPKSYCREHGMDAGEHAPRRYGYAEQKKQHSKPEKSAMLETYFL